MENIKELKLKRFEDLRNIIIKNIRSKSKLYNFLSFEIHSHEDKDFLNNIETLKKYRVILEKELKEYEEWFPHLKVLTLKMIPNFSIKHINFEGDLDIHPEIRERANKLLECHLKIHKDILTEIKAVDKQISSLEKNL